MFKKKIDPMTKNKKLSPQKRILYVIADPFYFISHRLPLALKAVENGYSVALATNYPDTLEKDPLKLEAKGIQVFHVPFDRTGMNPFKDLATLLGLLKVMRNYSPHIVHNVAMKPILYGSLISKYLGIQKIVNAIAGFGIVFSGTSLKARLLKSPMTFGLKWALKNTEVIVQNHEDQEIVSTWLQNKGKTHLILGAGVDCQIFTPGQTFCQNPIITFVSRMLWSKGVKELIEAACLLKQSHPKAIIQMVGMPDLENPDHVPTTMLEKWHDEGIIHWLKKRSDIADLYQKSQIAILPSYREGLPKSLIEACACGLAIITTDVPGCREVVENGVNGIIVPAKNGKALFEGLKKLLDDPERCQVMGKASYERALSLFENTLIQTQTLDIYQRS